MSKLTHTPSTFLTQWYLCLVMFLSLADHVQAQVITPPDVPAIEAYIYDHKKQQSLLLARATLEESNALLHKASKVTNKEYKEVNDQLDKYTKAFDIIDLVYSTVSTGFNVYRTYDNVSEKIGKYKHMLSDFNDAIVKRGRFETADTLLLTVNTRAIGNLAEECQNLYSSVTVIAAYATGKVHCTTATLMLMMDNINTSLDRIKAIVNQAYYQTWKFIQARTKLWKRELYRSKTIQEVASDAFGRWLEASRLTGY
ncbi:MULTISPECIES: hypothetical protein [Bacteroides]|jgi:hypothetical protein|nr:hypothetical protein [Bacteroides uniformis]